uniref:Uncharacterized protein n=1 Tax=Astatotilapia calliptera TaxID=8154 RepID=A0AAX7UB90_ASTCA
FPCKLSGVALITIGVLQYSTYSDIGTFTGSNLSKIAIVLIAVGVIIAFVSLLGHIGAFFNSSSMVALSLSLQFKCCGADSYADWSQSAGWEKHDAVPDSCCVEIISILVGVCLCLDIKRKNYENIS